MKMRGSYWEWVKGVQPVRMEKKDNNEDEGRVKRKDEYPPRRIKEERNGGRGWQGKGTATNEREEKKEEKREALREERLVIWIESTIHSNSRVLLAVRPAPAPFFAKIWMLLDLTISRP